MGRRAIRARSRAIRASSFAQRTRTQAVVPVALRCLGPPNPLAFSCWGIFSRICTPRCPFRISPLNLGRGEARQILLILPRPRW